MENESEKLTVNVNGKTFEDVSSKMDNWLQLKDDNGNVVIDSTAIEGAFGVCSFLVREIFDANGNEKTKGQKTLGVFTKDGKTKLVDKATISEFFGMKKSYSGTSDGETSSKKKAAKKAVEEVSTCGEILAKYAEDFVGDADFTVALNFVQIQLRRFAESKLAELDKEDATELLKKQLKDVDKEMKEAIKNGNYSVIAELSAKADNLKKQITEAESEEGNKEQVSE